MSGVGLTVYGVTALVFMMAMYALERRNRVFILAFALGCMLAQEALLRPRPGVTGRGDVSSLRPPAG